MRATPATGHLGGDQALQQRDLRKTATDAGSRIPLILLPQLAQRGVPATHVDLLLAGRGKRGG